MKKFVFLFISIAFLSSCLEDSNAENDYVLNLQKVDSYTVPAKFLFGKQNEVKIKYTSPNACYFFDGLYYQKIDTTRVIAVRLLKNTTKNCPQAIQEKEHTFTIHATQKNDYVLKFWKGKDADDKDIYEEVIVPVE